MSSYETGGTQAIADELVVNQTLDEIEAYQRGETAEEWAAAYTRAETFINDLYDTYTPEIASGKRDIGLLLGGIALAYVTLRYGDSEMTPKLYSGTEEQGVLATYHHAGHSRRFIDGLFGYATKRNEREPGTFDEDDFARFPGVGGLHDAIMGNGRGNDERQSGLLAVKLAQRLNIPAQHHQVIKVSVDATTWNSELGSGLVDTRWVLQQETSRVADLRPLFDRCGPYHSVALGPEDLSKKAYEQIFTREAQAAGFIAAGASIDKCMTFIDQRPALRLAYGRILSGTPKFYENFTPADPNLDTMYSGRAENIRFLGGLAAAYESKEMTALDTLAAAREYAFAA